MSRKLASIQKIIDIQPIPNADMIEVISVLGWKCVSKKGEFKVGDLCIYFECDSLIPIKPWSSFLEDKNKPGKPARLRTIRLRKQLSQGLVVPLSILEDCVVDSNNVEGFDVTELLGIELYEPPIPACLSGQVRGAFPSIVPKTDEYRIQSEPELLKEFQGIEVYWSLKMDGTSGTFVNVETSPPHHVCSRNMSLKDDGKNTYWKIYYKYNLEKVLGSNPNMAIQGECCGPSIQGNKMGLKDHELFIFNIYDIQQGRILGYNDMKEFCDINDLPMVPVIEISIFNITEMEDIIARGREAKYDNGALGEGYVIRPVVPRYSEVLNGRASFKILNNKFLEKHEKKA